MPAKHSTRYTRIFLVGFASLVLAFIVFGYLPYARSARALGAEMMALRQAMAQQVQNTQHLADATRRMQFVRLEVRDYDRLVPAKEDLGTFLGQLSQELENAAMRDTSVHALSPTTLGKCRRLPIEVRGSGTFAQLRDFLIRLENLPRMSSVNRLVIEADNSMTGKVGVELTLSIYHTRAD